MELEITPTEVFAVEVATNIYSLIKAYRLVFVFPHQRSALFWQFLFGIVPNIALYADNL